MLSTKKVQCLRNECNACCFNLAAVHRAAHCLLIAAWKPQEEPVHVLYSRAMVPSVVLVCFSMQARATKTAFCFSIALVCLCSCSWVAGLCCHVAVIMRWPTWCTACLILQLSTKCAVFYNILRMLFALLSTSSFWMADVCCKTNCVEFSILCSLVLFVLDEKAG